MENTFNFNLNMSEHELDLIPLMFDDSKEEFVLCDEPVKKVRFSDDVNEQIFDADRNDNICPKKIISVTRSDVPVQVELGFYFWDKDSFPKYFRNTKFNERDNSINIPWSTWDEEWKSPMNKSERNTMERGNYLSLDDPVKYVTIRLLTGNIKEELPCYPNEFLTQCLIYIYHLVNELEKTPIICLSYRESFKLSNLPGNDQRPIIRKKISSIVDHIAKPTKCICMNIL